MKLIHQELGIIQRMRRLAVVMAERAGWLTETDPDIVDRYLRIHDELQQAETRVSVGQLSWLSRICGLDIYGTTTLSQAAKFEMDYAAMVLAFVFLFNALAWSLFFYLIFCPTHVESLLSYLWCTVAGLMCALILFIYERGFIVTDTSSIRRVPLILSMTVRLSLVLSVAFITALPIELAAFAPRIEKRVQQERIRENVVGYYRELTEQGAQGKEKDDALDAWIRDLQHLPPSVGLRKEFAKNGAKKTYEFKLADYDIVEKIRILSDLRDGRPPQWRGGTGVIREALIAQYGMDDEDSTPDGKQRMATETKSLRLMYFVMLVISIYPNLTAPLFKLLMPISLATYYSEEWQQSVRGHPDSISTPVTIEPKTAQLA